jgi:hypothetical protein
MDDQIIAVAIGRIDQDRQLRARLLVIGLGIVEAVRHDHIQARGQTGFEQAALLRIVMVAAAADD